MKQKIRIQFADFWPQIPGGTIRDNPVFRILSERFDIELTENPDFLIYSCFGNEFLKYNCVRIFYTGENLRPDFNECDYAFSFDYPVTEKNYRLPLYKLYIDDFNKLKNRHIDADNIINEKRHFCNFLYSNGDARERIDFFRKLQKYRKIDSGGKVLNNLGFIVSRKVEFLQRYKFTIAFENATFPGYTTEKILHSFVAKSIPVYWGNPLVSRDFNTKAFINCHDYTGFDEVINRIIEIDNDNELYRSYLEEPVFTDNVENEFVNESNILDRFEKIFSGTNASQAAKKTDILKYHARKIINSW